MTTGLYKLTPFIHQRKYFAGLIFVVEGDHGKFFVTKISQPLVFLFLTLPPFWFSKVTYLPRYICIQCLFFSSTLFAQYWVLSTGLLTLIGLTALAVPNLPRVHAPSRTNLCTVFNTGMHICNTTCQKLGAQYVYTSFVRVDVYIVAVSVLSLPLIMVLRGGVVQ